MCGSGRIDKEAWEPVLQTLLVPQNSTSTTVTKPEVRIREAWAFDAPDHGDSAVANQAALKHLPEGVCRCLSGQADLPHLLISFYAVNSSYCGSCEGYRVVCGDSPPIPPGGPHWPFCRLCRHVSIGHWCTY